MKTDDPDVLLRKSQSDLKLLVKLARDDDVTDEQCGFCCQQAIEKAMKSVLARRGVDYPWTHDLTRLLLLLDDAAVAYPHAMREADVYTVFAVRFRYEDLSHAGDCAPFDRARAEELATVAVEWATAAAKGD